VPLAAPRSAYSKEVHQLIGGFAGAAAETKKKRFALPW
jgi:hypothetical protein